MPPQIKQAKLETLEAIIKEVEGMKVEKHDYVLPEVDDTVDTSEWSDYDWCGRDISASEAKMYNIALSDLLTKLQAELTLLKNER